MALDFEGEDQIPQPEETEYNSEPTRNTGSSLWDAIGPLFAVAAVILAIFLFTGIHKPRQIPEKFEPGNFTAVGKVVWYSNEYNSTAVLGFQTPGRLTYTIPVQRPFLYEKAVYGELKYHRCGPAIYCFDSWTTLDPQPTDKLSGK